jgi:hypothetical protein
MKPDLAQLIVPGKSRQRFRDVRDLFKRKGNDWHFTAEGFGQCLYQREIEDEFDSRMRRELGESAEELDWPNRELAQRRALREGRAICTRLAELGLIERYKPEYQNDRRTRYWQLSERGLTFREQKALRRIPRARGEALLVKAIDAARAFNADPGPLYHISALFLFGSLAKPGEGDVGDVDLIVIQRRREFDEAEMSWSMRKEARFAVIRPNAGSWDRQWPNLEGEARKRLQISRYISLAKEMLLAKLKLNGDVYRPVYEFHEGTAGAIEAKLDAATAEELEL